MKKYWTFYWGATFLLMSAILTSCGGGGDSDTDTGGGTVAATPQQQGTEGGGNGAGGEGNGNGTGGGSGPGNCKAAFTKVGDTFTFECVNSDQKFTVTIGNSVCETFLDGQVTEADVPNGEGCIDCDGKDAGSTNQCQAPE